MFMQDCMLYSYCFPVLAVGVGMTISKDSVASGLLSNLENQGILLSIREYQGKRNIFSKNQGKSGEMSSILLSSTFFYLNAIVVERHCYV